MSVFNKIFRFYKQSRIIRFFAQAALLLVIYFAVRYWQGREDIQGVAPMIQAVQLNGELVDMAKYRGAPVLLHFWATWCPVCRLESSNIAALAKDYPVISVVTWVESESEVVEYLREEGLDMSVIVDADQRWAKKYGIKAVPYSFIVDGNGLIRFIEKGYSTEFGLRARMWWTGAFDQARP